MCIKRILLLALPHLGSFCSLPFAVCVYALVGLRAPQVVRKCSGLEADKREALHELSAAQAHPPPRSIACKIEQANVKINSIYKL